METYTVRLGPKYQIVIPKAVREALHLGSEDRLLIMVEGGTVTLRPWPDSFSEMLHGLHREIWPDDLDAWLEEERSSWE